MNGEEVRYRVVYQRDGDVIAGPFSYAMLEDAQLKLFDMLPRILQRGWRLESISLSKAALRRGSKERATLEVVREPTERSES